jgi:alkylhydroperoxidase family enzyme
MVDAVLADYRTAPIDPKLKALLALVDKTARKSVSVTSNDVARARAAGWSDEALYDAITVCALFRFYNTWVDASGVSPLSDYSASGKRLASDGYAPEEPAR